MYTKFGLGKLFSVSRSVDGFYRINFPVNFVPNQSELTTIQIVHVKYRSQNPMATVFFFLFTFNVAVCVIVFQSLLREELLNDSNPYNMQYN